MPNDITTTPLVYKGEIIRDKGEMLSLTDMWIAGGRDDAKRPANWSRKDGAGFIDHTAAILNVPVGHIIKGTRGRTGETFAHWQIALAYAKYLNHDFHMWCNQVVRERMEGAAPANRGLVTDLGSDVRTTIGGIVKNVVHREIADALPALLDAMVSARLAQQSFLLRRGKTAGQIWKEAGFPRMRVTSWFSNRLCEMGCQIEGGGRGELGLGTAKLFDPDKAELWLKNGGRALVERYLAERKGQTKLRLVPTPIHPGAPA